MSLYILLYFIIIVFSFFVGIVFLRKYFNLGGVFYLIFTFFLSIWFIFFFLSYFSTSDLNILGYYSKIAYFSSSAGMYSFVLFLYFFTKKYKNPYKYFNIILLLFILFGYLYIFTPYIIDGFKYNSLKQDYYEVPGKLFIIHLIINILFIPIFLFVSYFKYKKLRNINKIRLKYILFGGFLFIFLGIIFQLLLPIYGIYILEKEVILFILPFLFFSWYSITRYHFIDISFRYKQIFSFFISIILTVLLFIYIRNITSHFSKEFLKYWEIKNIITYIDLIFGIIFYIFFYKIFSFIIPGNSEYRKFISILNKWKEKIPFITNLEDLNKFLLEETKNNFKLRYVHIKLLSNDDKNLQLYKFFSKDIARDIFINDLVFIEENKNKFDISTLKNEINKDIAIIFPMVDNRGELIGLFELGNKPFKEQFYSEEINIIRNFVQFIVGHLKYIEIYSNINDLNLNLDKKVDEKTMEYNNLLNNQTEFISMASHEIKSPIGSAIFQLDYILDEIKTGELSIRKLENELSLLNSTLIKVGELINKIFSVQKYELDKVKLYKQEADFKEYLNDILYLFSRLHNNMDLKIQIEDNIGFVSIDKIQFKQVIDNLLNNAFKFCNKTNPVISFNLKYDDKNIFIYIEDNGKGFRKGESDIIFEKYNSGSKNTTGLGLGLYLCKSIVELHGGIIKASNSDKLGGAKITIILSKNN